MVPVVPEEKKNGNPLSVFVEPYNILPVDKDAFKGEIPEITKRRVKTAYLPLAPKVERKDAKGNIMKDRKGNPLMTEPSYPIENFKVKRTFKPYETFVIRW